MATIGDGYLFVHLPKCAGTWITEVLTAKADGRQLSHKHATPAELDPTSFNGRRTFTFVRHPLTWYQSRWAFRMLNGWQPAHAMDRAAMSNDFNEFVRLACAAKPGGWLAGEVEAFTESAPVKVDVGRMELLVPDLVSFVPTLESSRAWLAASPRSNHSDNSGLKSVELAVYDERSIDLVMSSERSVIDGHYDGFDHLSLIGPQRA